MNCTDLVFLVIDEISRILDDSLTELAYIRVVLKHHKNLTVHFCNPDILSSSPFDQNTTSMILPPSPPSGLEKH